MKCCIGQSDSKFFLTLQECGFKPSIISYGCLINLYVKVCSSLVCSHVLQPDHRAEYALFFLLSFSFFVSMHQSSFIILVLGNFNGRMTDKIRYLKCSFDLNCEVIKLFDK
jgi:hypothetical protein